MKKYSLYQVDAFTKEIFTGNPAGVVSNADGLDEISMQKIARELNNSDTAQIKILSALGLSIDDKNENCPAAIASTGHSKVMIGIRDVEKLHALEPNLQELAAISHEINCNGYYVFVLTPEEKFLAHGRMFAPAIGIAEDPATGNANGPLGAYLCHFGLIDIVGRDKINFLAVQGEKINRRGTVRVEVSLQNEIPTKVKIVGDAVIAFKTTIEV